MFGRRVSFALCALVGIAVFAQSTKSANAGPLDSFNALKRALLQEAPAVTEPQPTVEPNITETETFNTTYAQTLFNLSGLSVTNSTIFAPTNDAFDALPVNLTSIQDLLNSTYADNSTSILKLHIVPGVYRSTDLPVGNTSVPTEAGINITIDNQPSGVLVYVPGSEVVASVVQPDIAFGDNIVHVIDTVLLPFPTSYDTLVNTTASGEVLPPGAEPVPMTP